MSLGQVTGRYAVGRHDNHTGSSRCAMAARSAKTNDFIDPAEANDPKEEWKIERRMYWWPSRDTEY